jgi:hypothetical protein
MMDRRQVMAGAAAASLATAASARPDDGALHIVELRQYLMQPNGGRDALIDLFEREFIETQETVGITVIGQFRDLDRPDRFVWLRGFPDMDSRAVALDAFYGGPVWKAHREAANATILDSDDVLVFHAADGAYRPPRERAAIGAAGPAGFVVAEIRYPKAGAEGEVIDLHDQVFDPAMKAAGARPLGAFASEHSPNTYPRLPVREAERAFLVLSGFAGPAAYDAYRRRLETTAWRNGPAARMAAFTDRPTQTLRLAPTPRSALR